MMNPSIRVLALDPGTRKTGFAIVDVLPEGIYVPFAETLDINKRLSHYQDTMHFLGEKEARFDIIADHVLSVMGHYKPSDLIAESPYMGSFAQTFATLTASLSRIDFKVAMQYPGVVMERITAPEVKKFMKVKGNSGDKTLMHQALLSCPVSYSRHLDPLCFDEHTVDAICVGLYKVTHAYL